MNANDYERYSNSTNRILAALVVCVGITNACKELWANDCDVDSDCCSKYCERGGNWKYGVCKNRNGGGGNTQSPPSNPGGAAESGICSWYGEDGEIPPGWPTGCGNAFNRDAMATAHRTLPCGTKIRVTNSANQRSVVVTVNDRGPHVAGRILDLTKAAFGVIEPDHGKGVIGCSYVVL